MSNASKVGQVVSSNTSSLVQGLLSLVHEQSISFQVPNFSSTVSTGHNLAKIRR